MGKINVTDCVHHGNGITYTFDNNSVAEIIHSSKIHSDVNDAQREAICRFMNSSRGAVNTDLRFEYGSNGENEFIDTNIEISAIDSKNGIVYLKNPSGLQIEVYKFTRHNKGTHKTYSDRLGKRYKPFNLLPYGAESWTIPASLHRKDKRNYMKFATYDPSTGERGRLTTVTLVIASQKDITNKNSKAFIDDIH